jgi:hypothetical protein
MPKKKGCVRAQVYAKERKGQEKAREVAHIVRRTRHCMGLKRNVGFFGLL